MFVRLSVRPYITLLSTHWLESWPDSTHKCNLKNHTAAIVVRYVKRKRYLELSYSQSPCPSFRFSLQLKKTKATVKRTIKYRNVVADTHHGHCEGHSTYRPQASYLWCQAMGRCNWNLSKLYNHHVLYMHRGSGHVFASNPKFYFRERSRQRSVAYAPHK